MRENLGKYKITEVIGRGAMGTVYKGFDPHICRTVAIKTIRKDVLESGEVEGLMARFKNEAQAAGRLSHPGIIAVYDYGEEESLAYIVMEYVQGSGLDEYFKRGTRFAAQDLVSLMAQLLDALEYAHDQGVIHRDIKPSNLMVMLNGRVKVADFGIARIDTSNLTQVGIIMGTPGYMAPEQYLDHGVDRRADIYSAGVIFYQLLSGRKPFIGSPAELMRQDTPSPPSVVDPARGLSQFDSIVARALARNPEDRFATAGEFREAILSTYRAPVSPSLAEETIIREAEQPQSPKEPTGPSQSAVAVGTQSTTGYPPEWDIAVLKQVEEHLVRIVGPVARVMVKKAARKTTDIDALYQLLAEGLSTMPDRTTFMASRSVITGAGRMSGRAAPAAEDSASKVSKPKQPLSPEMLDSATRLLATYVGPIAKVLTRKAAQQAGDKRQFYLLLAENLNTEAEKRRFLEAAGL